MPDQILSTCTQVSGRPNRPDPHRPPPRSGQTATTAATPASPRGVQMASSQMASGGGCGEEVFATVKVVDKQAGPSLGKQSPKTTAKELHFAVPAAAAAAASPAIKELKITLAIIDKEAAERVCCKSDGARFNGGADTTVKLRAGRVYTFAVSSAPPLAFEEEAAVRTRRAECYEPSALEACCGGALLLGGRGRSISDGGVKYADLGATEWGDPVALALAAAAPQASEAAEARRPSGARAGGGGSSGGERGGARAFDWTCDMELTGRGMRGEVELELSARGFGAVRLPLQAKVYGGGDRGARHGVALRAVEYVARTHGITGENRVLAAAYQQR